MQGTRRRIVEVLQRRGRATLKDLAAETGVAPATVRAHLDALRRDGVVEQQVVHGRVGRPFHLFSLSERGQEIFAASHARLATALLDALVATLDDATLDRVCHCVAELWATESARRLGRAPAASRAAAIARLRTEEGALAEGRELDDGSLLLVQHACPVPLVACRCQIVCEIERRYLAQLLNARVDRLEWIAEGGRTCTYRLHPLPSPAPSPPRRRLLPEGDGGPALPTAPIGGSVIAPPSPEPTDRGRA